MVHDVVIIGAGISGLVDAILMAETGARVLVLEQHKRPGGYLQQFHRKKTIFDVGFHYMGSTEKGRPMRQFLEHLQIWDRLQLIPFPEDAAIIVRNGERSFGYPTRFSSFVEKAETVWPEQRQALAHLFSEVERVCQSFKWFALKRGVEYQHPLDMEFSPQSLEDYLAPLVTDPWLAEVLSFQAFNLGLFAHEIPWVKHMLAFRSNFDTTSRVVGGGGGLVGALVERGQELGVEYLFKQDVVAFDCEKRQVKSVRTTDGKNHEAGMFIAACHPKPILRAISDADVKPIFKARVLEMKDSRGAFQVFIRLKEPLKSIGASCLMLRDEAEENGEPPLSVVLVTNPNAVEGQLGDERGGPRLEAMTYMGYEPFARWADEPLRQRGEEYDSLKQSVAERMIKMISKVAPELPDLIEDMYTGTPLTDKWYTRNENGAVFGISHDVSQQGTNRPMIRMRLKNLFFTGHSITMPGICGTFINAFDSCDVIRGDGVLFDSVAT